MPLIKISDELLAKLGAKTGTEFTEKVEGLLSATQNDQQNFSAVTGRIIAIEGRFEKIEQGLSALDKSLSTLQIPDAKAIIEQAKAEASKITAEALSVGGINPVKPAPVTEPTKANAAQALDDAGDYEGAFAANPKLQAEFIDAKNYAAFRTAQKLGQFKVQSRQ